jgi:hypothetical protein
MIPNSRTGSESLSGHPRAQGQYHTRPRTRHPDLLVDIYIGLKVVPGPIARWFAGLGTRRRRDLVCGREIGERLSHRWLYNDHDGHRCSRDELAAWLTKLLNELPDDLVKDFAGKDFDGRERGASAMSEAIAAALYERWEVVPVQRQIIFPSKPPAR